MYLVAFDLSCFSWAASKKSITMLDENNPVDTRKGFGSEQSKAVVCCKTWATTTMTMNRDSQREIRVAANHKRLSQSFLFW